LSSLEYASRWCLVGSCHVVDDADEAESNLMTFVVGYAPTLETVFLAVELLTCQVASGCFTSWPMLKGQRRDVSQQ
jgi:hypothetical protein